MKEGGKCGQEIVRSESSLKISETLDIPKAYLNESENVRIESKIQLIDEKNQDIALDVEK